MPDVWSKTDERQYQHVRDSELQRGVEEARAGEIAGRTVNRHRREKGRTLNKRTQGRGDPNAALPDLTCDERYNRARKQNVRGRSKVGKDGLVGALQQSLSPRPLRKSRRPACRETLRRRRG